MARRLLGVSSVFVFLVVVASASEYKTYTPSPEYDAPAPSVYTPSPPLSYAPSPKYKAPVYTPSPEYKASPVYKKPTYTPSPEYKAPTPKYTSPSYKPSPKYKTPLPNYTPTPSYYVEEKLAILYGVQGVIYCQNYYDFTPLEGATAELSCKSKGHKFSKMTPKTDKNGYFLVTFTPEELGEYLEPSDCKVFLESSPSKTCNIATDIGKGITGAPLTHPTTLKDFMKSYILELYSVPPFVYTSPKYETPVSYPKPTYKSPYTSSPSPVYETPSPAYKTQVYKTPIYTPSPVYKGFPLVYEEATAADRCEWFQNMMTEYFQKTQNLNIKNIDLFVFPIWHSEHYYMIAVNVKTPRIDLIDNSDSGDFEAKYRNIPSDLRKFFTVFLEKNDMKDKAAPLKDQKNVPVVRLEMPWRDNVNKTDCGLFLLRHMETYFDNGLDDWESDLIREDEHQILSMRIKYSNIILDSHWNEKRTTVREFVALANKKK